MTTYLLTVLWNVLFCTCMLYLYSALPDTLSTVLGATSLLYTCALCLHSTLLESWHAVHMHRSGAQYIYYWIMFLLGIFISLGQEHVPAAASLLKGLYKP